MFRNIFLLYSPNQILIALKKLFTPFLFLLAAFSVKAQTRGFGNIDTADLKLSSCAFEKDANAMVLFDGAKVTFYIDGELLLERHRRIKIFNEKGKEFASVKMEYDNMYGADDIYNVEAQTINLDNGKIVTRPLDPKLIYSQHTDKNKDAIICFPNVKAGSVIEYRYRLHAIWQPIFLHGTFKAIFQPVTAGLMYFSTGSFILRPYKANQRF